MSNNKDYSLNFDFNLAKKELTVEVMDNVNHEIGRITLNNTHVENAVDGNELVKASNSPSLFLFKLLSLNHENVSLKNEDGTELTLRMDIDKNLPVHLLEDINNFSKVFQNPTFLNEYFKNPHESFSFNANIKLEGNYQNNTNELSENDNLNSTLTELNLDHSTGSPA
ncbi:MAG: hypothetical protein J0H68_03235 [Sphingobacteriia bacterium]|nr:hypothetical protein [Sphingobacteriia bacterium]